MTDYRRKVKVWKKAGEVFVVHPAFDIEEATWSEVQEKTKSDFGSSKASYAMRLLVHGYNEGMIDLKAIEEKLDELEKTIWVG